MGGLEPQGHAGHAVKALRLPGGPLTVLCLGAHSDDIEIGCGGTLLLLLATRRVRVTWVVFAASGPRAAEARSSATRFLRDAAAKDVRVQNFRDGFLPYQGTVVKEFVETLKNVRPDVVFTHHRHDRHQDHRLVSDLTWNTFRDHLVLEYEVPKYDGDLTTPNLYVPLPPAVRRRKVSHLLAGFATQRSKRWFSAETFDGLMRVRGIECAAPSGYAEGFHGSKTVLDLGGT